MAKFPQEVLDSEWSGALRAAWDETYVLTKPPVFDGLEGEDEISHAVIHRALALMDPEMREEFVKDYDLTDNFSNESLFIAWSERSDEERMKVKWVVTPWLTQRIKGCADLLEKEAHENPNTEQQDLDDVAYLRQIYELLHKLSPGTVEDILEDDSYEDIDL